MVWVHCYSGEVIMCTKAITCIDDGFMKLSR